MIILPCCDLQLTSFCYALKQEALAAIVTMLNLQHREVVTIQNLRHPSPLGSPVPNSSSPTLKCHQKGPVPQPSMLVTVVAA